MSLQQFRQLLKYMGKKMKIVPSPPFSSKAQQSQPKECAAGSRNASAPTSK